MAPNLFVLAQTAVKPHRWFKSSEPSVPLTRTEIWSEPLPGVYKHTPGRGWALVAVEDGTDFQELERPRKVVYCKCLHRFLFEDDFESRKTQGFYLNRPAHKEAVTFFRLDDGITWVQSFDSEGNFIPGPYERFVLDTKTAKFRPMLKTDDPEWQARRISASSANSAVSSLHCSSGPNSAAMSRENSYGYDKPSKSRPVSSSTLQVPESEQSKAARPQASSRPSSRARPVREENLPRL